VTTGAITVDFESGPPVVAISEEDAVAAILEGHEAKAYTLPSGVLNAAAGAAALVARAIAVHKGLNEAAAALSEGTGRLVAELVRESATSGAIPELDPGATMVDLEATVVRLRYEDAVYQVASEKLSAYPISILRSNAAAVASALDTALSALLTDAAPHAAKIAALSPGADNLRAHRADGPGFDALERLVPRLAALEAAAEAMARLGSAWPALAGQKASVPAVIRLAIMAATP
jgi:hypothetical protein